MDNEERYFITGAGGFIGGWLSEILYLEGKVKIRAGINRWSGAARLARFPMEIVLCDILTPEEINKALNGVTHIIHCAKGPSSESIIQGTRNLLEASLQQGIKRFIYMSTAEVYGNPSGIVNETYQCENTGNSYGDSKLQAEMVCREYIAKGVPITIIRPSIVYGPFSKTWTVNIGYKLQSGNWGIFKGNGDGTCNLIYILDLVNATLLAAQHPRAVGEVFNVNGPDKLTWNQYFERFNASIKLPELKVISPTNARLRAVIMEPARTAAKFARSHLEQPIKKLTATYEPVKKTVKYLERIIKTTPRVTDFSLFNRNAFYNAQKIHELLGFKPEFDLDSGLALTILWMDHVGYIKNS